jgi:hypothetical protein
LHVPVTVAVGVTPVPLAVAVGVTPVPLAVAAVPLTPVAVAVTPIFVALTKPKPGSDDLSPPSVPVAPACLPACVLACLRACVTKEICSNTVVAAGSARPPMILLSRRLQAI